MAGVISTPVVLAVLVSAMMHAGWNFIVKASEDKLLDTVLLALGGCTIAAFALPWIPLPAADCLPWLGISIFVHVGYFIALIEAYRHADLSVAYPLMRGSAPVLVVAAAPLFGEGYAVGTLLGVGLVGLGIMLPAIAGLRAGTIRRAGLGMALGNALIIALYTFLDGIGVRHAGNALSYTFWLFFLNAWGIFAVALWCRGSAVMLHVRRRWPYGLAGAVLTVGSYGIVLWAMSIASIPAVAALRETSVIFAALLGCALLKEQMGSLRVSGAALIALGAAIIRWA